jgi:phosphosulfolactate synthase (CoM biosynthesis protein A)
MVYGYARVSTDGQSVPVNERPAKPRARGVTEIRGPYYAVMGRRYLEDILDTMHPYVDGLKFAGGPSR